MGGFNPCGCWNLKDGCVTVGIWTLLFCIIQFGLFGWQTSAVKDQKDISSNNYYAYDKGPYPGDAERYYEQSFYANRDSRFWTGLFVVQILVLIVTFFLLFATVALIYGIHTESKYLVWPWFPCMIANIMCCMAYCILWWAGINSLPRSQGLPLQDIQSYWMALTIVEMFGVIVNIYAFICVLTYYTRIPSGRRQTKEKKYGFWNGGDDGRYGQNTMVMYNKQNGQPTVQTLPPDAVHGFVPNDPYNPPLTQPIQYVRRVHFESPHQGQYNFGYDQGTPVAMHGNKPGQVYIAGVGDQQAGPLPPKQPYGWEQQPQPMPMEPQPPIDTMQPVQQPGGQFLENWLSDANQYVPTVGAVVQTAPNTPLNQTGDGALPIRPAQSEPDIEAERKREKHRSHRHRSHSVRSRRSRKRYDSDSGDSDEDYRSRTHRHRGHRSRSHSRDQPKYAYNSDTETAYSRSTHSHHHHHRHHKHDRDRDRDYDSKQRYGRNMRDVKRRNNGSARPETSTSATSTGPSGLKPSGSSGAITIPQKIVIPPSKGNANKQPQRYHINSEITISYSDSSRNPSDTETVRRQRQAALAAANGGVRAVTANPDPTVTSPVTDEEKQPKSRPHSYGQESGDSKAPYLGSNHGSTAV